MTTTYYFAGSTRIAMRQGGVLSYLAGDHLGSTSLTLNTSGAKNGEMRYCPYGETRSSWGSVPTDRRFTGQRQEDAAALGSLYDYGARFYSVSLGRFISADTVVPDPKNPQSLNRFAYVTNNPLKYIDPSGHMFTECAEGCSLTDFERDKAIGKLEELKSRKFYRDCAQGGGSECNTLHEVEALPLAIGIAVVGGAAIGVGAGLVGAASVTSSTVASLLGTGLIGAGTGALTGAGVTVAREWGTGQTLDPRDILINSADTAGAGFVSGIIPGQTGWVIAARASFNGAFAAHASIWSSMCHVRPVDGGKALVTGGASAFMGAIVGKISSALNPEPKPENVPLPYSPLAREQVDPVAAKALAYGFFNAFAIQIPLTLVGTPR